MNIWVPLANLTYSIYLYHLVMIGCMGVAVLIVANASGKDVPGITTEATDEESSDEIIDASNFVCIFDPTEELKMWLITLFLSLFLSILIATCVFVFIEK